MTSDPRHSQVGLRARKKAQTRTAIQDAALTLFERQGYAATTIAEIAAAADVSERTFFRYFPTKEDVVQFDRFDVSMVEAFREQPPHLGVMDAARNAIEETLAAAPPGELQAELLRHRLLREEPELRATLVTTISSGEMPELFTQALTERLGERAEEAKIRVFVAAVIGLILQRFFNPDAPTDAEGFRDFATRVIDDLAQVISFDD